ncbi:MAG: pyruvate kinase [Granulosicoccus sp.]|jgi:pyruvate kinase
MINKTKIIATIGPKSSSKEMLKSMMENGMNIARINFSHGEHSQHLEVIKTIRELNKETNRHVGILADLQGPKIRLGDMKDGDFLINDGDEFEITTEDCNGDKSCAHITYPTFPQDVSAGDKILINDGKLVLEAVSSNGTTSVKTKVIHGGLVESRKGVNLPNTKISMPSLTEKDRHDLAFILENNIEWIGLSFVRSAEDLIELRHLVANAGKTSRLIAKIEKPEAVRDLDSIIREADGVMVARGDLGVEVPMEQVPVIQKMIVKKCLNHCKPVIIATQMMESMIENPQPSRAEVNDVANSVMDGADALMLSGETSVGEHPDQVITAMHSIINYIESYEDIYYRKLLPQERKDRIISDAICENSVHLSQKTGAVGIVTMTNSGYTAYRIGSYRPKTHIFVFTDNRALLNTLSLAWGVEGFYYDKYVSTDHTIADIMYKLKKEGFVSEGDLLINIASMPISDKGQSNMLKLSEVD